MANSTRYKELEKLVIGMKQHQDLQEWVESHHKYLDELAKKMGLLLESLNGGPQNPRHHHNRNPEKEFQSKELGA